jgi:hypothetical protein
MSNTFLEYGRACDPGVTRLHYDLSRAYVSLPICISRPGKHMEEVVVPRTSTSCRLVRFPESDVSILYPLWVCRCDLHFQLDTLVLEQQGCSISD